MRRGAAFALLFLVVFAGVLAVRLPLRWALPLLPKSLQCLQPEGSLWSGSCRGFSLSGTALSLDLLEWDLKPAGLLKGSLVMDVALRRQDAAARALLHLSPGRLEIQDAVGSGSLEPGMPGPLAGWSGRLEFKALFLRYAGGQLESLAGVAEARDLRSPQGTRWGSYRIDMPRSASSGLPPARLVSLEGPLRLEGIATLSPQARSWQLDARVALQPDADPALAAALGALGPPDAQGLRPLSVAGSY